MRKARMLSTILSIVGIMMISIALVVDNEQSYKEANKIQFTEIDMASVASSASMIASKVNETKEEVTPSVNEVLPLQEVSMEVVPASVVVEPIVIRSYDEMTLNELGTLLYTLQLPLKYSEVYTYNPGRLTKSRGVVFFVGHRETYYSQRVLPGNGLRIPGRHVADDGTVRDGEGYICVAADPNYLPYGTLLLTSLGPAKVYDSGCAYGTIDIYTDW